MNSSFVLCLLGLIVTVSGHVAHAQDSPSDYVNSHNEARSKIFTFKIPHVVWDKKIATFAQNYANQRKDCKLIPSGSHYGENLAVSAGNMSGKDAVKLWVDEEPHYNHYLNECDGGECLHYTQVIWQDSRRIGCGKVRCDNGGTFITCNYDPRGNIPGQTPF
ncbi:pathogenesis-related protein 1-like [Trifolium pratense]|uniref:pathogenesis-related protein 1-like n=1 Tax=Trifolium pratense TaxID=57577 RepID=UPI001E6936A6|nr:pathogenesis-related protein 1-like [Trifolium pratense]